MSKTVRYSSKLRYLALFGGLLLPTLTLVPLGSIWLWQNGFLLYWALAAMLCVAVTAWWQRRLLKSLQDRPELSADAQSAELPDASWTSAEASAWAAVTGLAKRVDVKSLTSPDAVFRLGLQTIAAVAHRLHPEVKDPLWQFTVPEAFALTERVSRKLRGYATDNVPLGDRMTVAQMLAIYRWRGVLDVADKAYDVWRFMRLANPVTAATHELRERLSKQMLEMGRAHVADRLVEAYVKEVGRAAIDLYGGRLRVPLHQMENSVSPASMADTDAIGERTREPVRILVAGRAGADKTLLTAALVGQSAPVGLRLSADQLIPYKIERASAPNALLIEAADLGPSRKAIKRLVADAINCDLLVLVIAAGRDHSVERNALTALRQALAKAPNRHLPPIVVVRTAAADLPATEAGEHAIARDLGVDADDAITVRRQADASYDVATLWAYIDGRMPSAHRAKFSRQLAGDRLGWNWRRLWSQTVGASRVAGRALRR